VAFDSSFAERVDEHTKVTSGAEDFDHFRGRNVFVDFFPLFDRRTAREIMIIRQIAVFLAMPSVDAVVFRDNRKE
jgi:hypothetical protein